MLAKKSFFLCFLTLVGCGGEVPGSEDLVVPTREVEQPLLREIAPSAIRVGQELTIFGEKFSDRSIGETRVTFEGVYQTTAGKVVPVNLEVTPSYVNQGVLSYTFGPNVPFANEEDTGYFRGVVKARNVGLSGTVKDAPGALATEIQVLPSILIRQLRPVEMGCSVGLTDTVASTPMLVELKAIGLKSGNEGAPLRFIYTFMKEHFSFDGYYGAEQSTDPEALFPPSGPLSVIDDVENGTISALGAGAAHNIFVYKGAAVANKLVEAITGPDELFSLTRLITATVPTGDSFKAQINVLAVDSTGQEAMRTLALNIWTPIEVKTEGQPKIVRSFDPVPVSGCITGSDVGGSVTYKEMTSETRDRSYTTTSSVSMGADVFVAKLNEEFGFNVQERVSSEKAQELQVEWVMIAGQKGVIYRQTYQLEHRGKLISHGPCGHTQMLGDVVVTDWLWAPDLAKTNSCPPFPTSNLPPGEVFE